MVVLPFALPATVAELQRQQPALRGAQVVVVRGERQGRARQSAGAHRSAPRACIGSAVTAVLGAGDFVEPEVVRAAEPDTAVELEGEAFRIDVVVPEQALRPPLRTAASSCRRSGCPSSRTSSRSRRGRARSASCEKTPVSDWLRRARIAGLRRVVRPMPTVMLSVALASTVETRTNAVAIAVGASSRRRRSARSSSLIAS